MVTVAMNRSYSELSKLSTFEERFQYLKLDGQVGKETFGYDRYLNQILYTSKEWRRFRRDIITRDNGCDLGLNGYSINGEPILVHHLNPITKEDILNRDPKVMDPENVICTRKNTHDLLHYSNESQLIKRPIERSKNDTCPWRH